MNRSYELWDIESGNIIGAFPTEEEALHVVRTLLEAYGSHYAEALSLSSREGMSPSSIVATGENLARD